MKRLKGWLRPHLFSLWRWTWEGKDDDGPLTYVDDDTGEVRECDGGRTCSGSCPCWG